MNILLVLSRYPFGERETDITKDLALTLKENGHSITVVTVSGRSRRVSNQLSYESGVRVLRVKSGNLFGVSKYEKFLTVLSLPFKLGLSIFSSFSEEKFDLVITHTPFMASALLVNALKRRYSCKALLLLWDIFPQNAVDIGLMRKGLLYCLFKAREKKMLRTFDLINCMSEGNRSYLLEHYSYFQESALIINSNWGIVNDCPPVSRTDIRQKYGFVDRDLICVFGGNIGLPQKIENILKIAEHMRDFLQVKFVFVGKGTEFQKLRNIKCQFDLDNVYMLDHMCRTDYQSFMSVCDVGLISLHEGFTVPNFPSKTTDYFKYSLPIFALLDPVSLADYGIFVADKAKAGFCVLASDFEEQVKALTALLSDKNLRKVLGRNGRIFFEDNLNVVAAAENLLKAVDGVNVAKHSKD